MTDFGTTRQIHPLGQSQLEQWEKLADLWLMVPRMRDGQLHIICPKCDVSVYAASEQSITPATFKAATVAHLRNLHRELDPDA
jgi:hypothetical protein